MHACLRTGWRSLASLNYMLNLKRNVVHEICSYGSKSKSQSISQKEPLRANRSACRRQPALVTRLVLRLRSLCQRPSIAPNNIWTTGLALLDFDNWIKSFGLGFLIVQEIGFEWNKLSRCVISHASHAKRARIGSFPRRNLGCTPPRLPPARQPVPWPWAISPHALHQQHLDLADELQSRSFSTALCRLLR